MNFVMVEGWMSSAAQNLHHAVHALTTGRRGDCRHRVAAGCASGMGECESQRDEQGRKSDSHRGEYTTRGALPFSVLALLV